MVGGRQVSGTGGAVAFLRGAARSRRGRAIVALPATARTGTVSRIVASLPGGTVVTASRADVDYVVTEHGVARLRGGSIEERAETLIAIAEPGFREGLWDAWRDLVRGRSASSSSG